MTNDGSAGHDIYTWMLGAEVAAIEREGANPSASDD
jgi:hypothetical protein